MEAQLTQRSVEWRQLRLGSVTASRFHDVLTQPKSKEDRESGAWSATARAYMLEKLTEFLTGVPCDRFQSPPTRWGTEWESEAREKAIPVIKEQFGLDVQLPVGDMAFIRHPREDYIGCSPDGVLGPDALLELKAPWNPVNHLRTVMSGEMPKEHQAQIQGSLWIMERQCYVFCSYDPRLNGSGMSPLFYKLIPRDEEYIALLAPKVIAFRDWVLAEYERLTGKAPF